jgi:hypothetical protein
MRRFIAALRRLSAMPCFLYRLHADRSQISALAWNNATSRADSVPARLTERVVLKPRQSPQSRHESSKRDGLLKCRPQDMVRWGQGTVPQALQELPQYGVERPRSACRKAGKCLISRLSGLELERQRRLARLWRRPCVLTWQSFARRLVSANSVADISQTTSRGYSFVGSVVCIE